MTGRLLTLDEAARALGCSSATVRRRVSSGALPVFVDGRLVRVRDVDLGRYVAERTARRSPESAAVSAGRVLPAEARLWD